MRERILEQIRSGWEGARAGLVERAEEAFRLSEELLRLEDYLREGRTSESLGRSLRGFGEKSIDLSGLSVVMGAADGKRRMAKERYERIRAVHLRSRELLERWRRTPPEPCVAELSGGAEELLARASAHFNELSEPFRLARVARLETRAKYDPSVHDAHFREFGWEQFDDEEIRLSAPFVLLAVPGDEIPELPALIRLLSSGCPVRIVLLRSVPARRPGKTGRSAALRSGLDVEMLPVALRGAYLLQCSTATPEFPKRLAAALGSPRPAVISLFCPPHAGAEDFRTRAEKALSSRAHPVLVYDPNRSAKFVECFDLSGNPAPERDWPLAKMNYRDENGRPQDLEYEFTFAHFAAGEPAFAEEFSALPADLEGREAVPLARYLALHPEQRAGKVPFVHRLTENGRLAHLLPSAAMIVQTAERLKLWRALRELAGILNPHVTAAERRVASTLRAEQEKALQELERRLQFEAESRAQQAVETAMRRLAERLIGVAAAAGPVRAAPAVLSQARAAPAPVPKPAAAAPPAEPAETPWIESRRCTTCDECINVNKKIFAYNADKQAYVKDPKGGPFKDIVRAAEKCSAKIIHTGKPADPGEKDLAKWVERAAAYP